MLFIGDQMHPGAVKKADEMKTGVLVYKKSQKSQTVEKNYSSLQLSCGCCIF